MATTGLVQTKARNLVLHLSFLHGWQYPRHVGHSLLSSKVYQQELYGKQRLDVASSEQPLSSVHPFAILNLKKKKAFAYKNRRKFPVEGCEASYGVINFLA